jgi:hypothetical protein
MRYVVARSIDRPQVKRRFWVGAPSILSLLKAANGEFITRYLEAQQEVWRVTHYGPEVVQYLPTTDTGQDDGTPGLT